jgi:predicted CoA-binding protein
MKTVEDILKESRVIAVVGLSANPEKASYRVAAYLKSCGYKIIPVNPGENDILGEHCHASLSSIPEKVDVVDIFRRAEDVPTVVEEAIGIRARTVWMQLGIVNEAAAEKARRAGLTVVMNACLMVEHRRLHSPGEREA